MHFKLIIAFVEDKNLLKTYIMKNKAEELSAIELQTKVETSKTIESNNLQPSSNNAKITRVKELQFMV